MLLDDSYRQWIKADLLKRLYADYPGDVGCFTIYLFNYITMQPGEAIYIGPNIPHAYLSGGRLFFNLWNLVLKYKNINNLLGFQFLDCIECMACSDNVIRAGLTPKPKDVPTLIQILSFECELASARKIQPFREDVFTEVFRPPVPEFAVAKITVSFVLLFNTCNCISMKNMCIFILNTATTWATISQFKTEKLGQHTVNSER